MIDALSSIEHRESKNENRALTPSSSPAQDIALSRRRRRFESGWGRFYFWCIKINMQEDKRPFYTEAQESEDTSRKCPPGVLILGGINLLIFGIASFIFSLSAYTSIPSGQDKLNFSDSREALAGSNQNILFRELEKHWPEGKISSKELKLALALQLIVAGIFSLSGLGLIFKKEPARQLTIYFSFLIVVLVFFFVLLSPQAITQGILQVIYPGILIIYFTNKNVEKVFLAPEKADGKQA